jgi:hypothetical protein
MIYLETSAVTSGRPLISFEGRTLTAGLAGNRLWQQNLASLIRLSLFSRAAPGEANG